MSDTITQTRLAMRLDNYLREYMAKSSEKTSLFKEEWEHVWRIAKGARKDSILTPELVDDVRIVLNKF